MLTDAVVLTANMSRVYLDWEQRNLKQALEVSSGVHEKYGGSDTHYAETLLCCYLAAMSARLWPTFGDRRRFCKLLREFGPPEMTKVALPLLYQDKDKKGLLGEKFPGLKTIGDIFLFDQLSCDVGTVVAILPELTTEEIEKYTLASLTYVDLRCSLVHEGQLSENLASRHMSFRYDVPSYVNRMCLVENPEKNMPPYRHMRLLHFPYVYVAALTKSIAENVFKYWETAGAYEKPLK